MEKEPGKGAGFFPFFFFFFQVLTARGRTRCRKRELVLCWVSFSFFFLSSLFVLIRCVFFVGCSFFFFLFFFFHGVFSVKESVEVRVFLWVFLLAMYPFFGKTVLDYVVCLVRTALNITRGEMCTSSFSWYTLCYSSFSWVPTGSPSRGGDVAVYVFDINQPSLPTPFYSALVSVSVFMAVSFHKSSQKLSAFSLSSSDLFLPYWPFQLYISLWKPPSALIKSSVVNWA